MIKHSFLYFIPEKGDLLKIQPGTGDGLTSDDIADGYINYIIWNRFKPECLDIDGELPMECIDSGLILTKEDDQQTPFNILGRVLDFAYRKDETSSCILLCKKEILPKEDKNCKATSCQQFYTDRRPG